MPTVKITTPEGQSAERNACGGCIAAVQVPGNRVECHRNPPGVMSTGKLIWPSVDPDHDWCLQWKEAE